MAETKAGDMTDAMTASATLVLMGFLAFLLIPASAALLNHVLLLHR